MKRKRYLILFIVLWVAAPGVLAQESGIQIGAATLYPTVGLAFGYDDNITLSPDNEISSWYYLISPAIRLQTGGERNAFVFEYALDYVDYKDSDFDDYTDHSLSGVWQYAPTVRDEMSLRGRIDFGHDRRGEGLSDFFPGTAPREVDKFETYSIDAFYRHGADGARGRIQLEAGLTEKDYKNNRELTALGDYEELHFDGSFFWRVANKSSLLLEVGISEMDYQFSDRDNEEVFVGVGLEWEATARTEGRASYRYLEMNFDDDQQGGYTGTAWELAIRWRPRINSVVELSALRETDVSFGGSNLLVRQAVDLSWRHEWRPRFATFLDTGWQNEDFDPGPRDDDTYFYGLGASYAARYWLDMGLSFRHYNRDSSLDAFDYERNEFLLSFELSL